MVYRQPLNIMTNVIKEMTCGNFDHVSGTIKVTGDFKINNENGAVESLNASVFKADLMAGNVNTTLDGGKIKINMYGVDINDSEEVMTVINTIVNDLYNKYKKA